MATKRSEDGVARGSDAAFPKEEIDARQRRLKRVLAAAGIDLYLTSGAENIFWLSGQQTPGYYTFQCLAVPAKGAAFLMLRGLETHNARANSYLSRIVGYADDANPGDAAAEIVETRGFKGRRIAIDRNAWFLTANLFDRLRRRLGRLEDGSGIVESLRRVQMLRPGRTCADAHNAVQAVIDAAGCTEAYRKRSGYSIGIAFAPDWGEGNILSLYRGVDVAIEPGMVFHVPITLRDYGRFTVAVSETIEVTARGPRILGKLGQDLVEV